MMENDLERYMTFKRKGKIWKPISVIRVNHDFIVAI